MWIKLCVGVLLAANSVSYAEQNVGMDFSLKLFKLLLKSSTEKNLVFSPYAVRSALSMAAVGAKGKTQKQLGKTIETISLSKESAYKLSFANRLWVQMGYPLQEPYLETMDKSNQARPWVVDFTKAPDFVRDRINGWVEERTVGKVRGLLSENGLESSTRMILTSGAYFKGEWVTPFDDPKESGFKKGSGGSVQAPFLNKTGQFGYKKLHDFQVLALPYIGGDIEMIVILPSAGADSDKVLQSLKSESLGHWVEDLSLHEVKVSIPKFELTSAVNPISGLKELGVVDPFSAEAANFSGMTGKNDLSIGQMLHKTVFSLTASGTEAGSQGATEMTRSPASSPIAFVADHPFYFMIRHKSANSLLFIGYLSEL